MTTDAWKFLSDTNSSSWTFGSDDLRSGVRKRCIGHVCRWPGFCKQSWFRTKWWPKMSDCCAYLKILFSFLVMFFLIVIFWLYWNESTRSFNIFTADCFENTTVTPVLGDLLSLFQYTWLPPFIFLLELVSSGIFFFRKLIIISID